MLSLTRRVKNITPSLTLELTGKVQEMKRKGIDVISFGLGEPDFGTPENICAAAKKAIDEQKTKYTAIGGIGELKEAICEKFKRDNGIIYKPSQICIGTGAKQPLVNSVLAVCEEGDEVLIPTPCYVSYVEMVKLAGATPVLVPCKESDGFQLDIPAIRKAVTDKTKAIMINTPNNPTGAVYSKETMTALGELAVEKQFYIISDEVYEMLTYDGKKHYCIAQVSEEVKKLSIVINGFSKAYSMTGWRCGYVAAEEAIVKAVTAIQGHTTSNTCSITQYAALEALRGPQDSVETMRQEFDRRRKFLLKRLNEIDGISCVNAEGAFYLMPNVTSFYGKKAEGREIRDSFDLANYLLEEARINIVPGGAYESPDNMRISYSNSMEALVEGMDRMEAALKKIH